MLYDWCMKPVVSHALYFDFFVIGTQEFLWIKGLRWKCKQTVHSISAGISALNIVRAANLRILNPGCTVFQRPLYHLEKTLLCNVIDYHQRRFDGLSQPFFLFTTCLGAIITSSLRAVTWTMENSSKIQRIWNLWVKETRTFSLYCVLTWANQCKSNY